MDSTWLWIVLQCNQNKSQNIFLERKNDKPIFQQKNHIHNIPNGPHYQTFNPYKLGGVFKLGFYLSIYNKIAINLRIAHTWWASNSMQENSSFRFLYSSLMWDVRLALFTYDYFIPTNASVHLDNLQVLEPAKSVHSDVCKWHTMHPLFRAARIPIMWIWVRAREQFPRRKDARSRSQTSTWRAAALAR